ncbi:uncharacterized protein N7459_001168 [Penicillium hispanicum]|uniref:uncharacterized protein n=1 Tax=Penicillium hispanicum TaxID=1080232 RepID=UPI00253F9353|nr:uncharacterized protein N7459_001168 [Penicillium hispanicum]KAJ5594960.1 hypothetical protein N7459_001168 [Penicillium hispanicum]
MGSVVEIDPDGDLMVILSKPKSSFESYRSFASLDKSTFKPSTLSNTNDQSPSLFGTNFQAPRLFDTNTPPTSLFGTNPQVPSLFGTDTQAPRSTNTNTRGQSLFGTDTRRPSLFGTNFRVPRLFDTDIQASSSSDTNTRAPSLFGTDAPPTSLFGTDTHVPSSSNSNTRGQSLFGTDAQRPSLFGTDTQVRNYSNTNTQAPSLFGTDAPPTSLFGTDTQVPSSSNSNTRGQSLFRTDAQRPRLFGTNFRVPRLFDTDSQPPSLFGTDSQVPSPSNTNTRAPGSFDADTQSSYTNSMFTSFSARAVQFKVSSKHLILACPRFKRMLSGEWLEANTVHADGCRHVVIEGFDTRSLEIVLNALHGKNRKVPRAVDIRLLTDIAVLVDDLECHEEIEVFSQSWITQLRRELPAKWTMTLVPWIFVSFTFNKPDIYTQATRTAILKLLSISNPGMVHVTDSCIADELNLRRERAIQNAISYGKDVTTQLLEGKAGCTLACQSILLGAWMKGLLSLNILEAPKSPYTGLAVSQLHQAMRKIQCPKWGSESRTYLGEISYDKHRCDFDAFTSHIGRLYDSIDGLTDLVKS